MTDSELAEALRLAANYDYKDGEAMPASMSYAYLAKLSKALLALHERVEAAEAVCREVQGMSQWGDIIAREATGHTNWNVLMTKLEAWRKARG
jgi:hypothetical protein